MYRWTKKFEHGTKAYLDIPATDLSAGGSGARDSGDITSKDPSIFSQEDDRKHAHLLRNPSTQSILIQAICALGSPIVDFLQSRVHMAPCAQLIIGPAGSGKVRCYVVITERLLKISVPALTEFWSCSRHSAVMCINTARIVVAVCT